MNQIKSRYQVQNREKKTDMKIHMNIAGKTFCNSKALVPSLTGIFNQVTCENCLRRIKKVK